MGQLTRDYDWSKTTLGQPDRWPQSLRTTLSILLNSKFPMFLFWGPELLCFYNDAYRPSLGNQGKHPKSLGQPGAEAWPETWPTIKPLIDQVLNGQEATWSEDQLIPIFRNGRLEDVYWTFSYSPVSDESGQPAGVFVTCTETTRQVELINQLQLSEQRFQNLVRGASVGIIVLSGPQMRVTIVNDAYAQLINRPLDQLQGRYLFEVVPEATDPFKGIVEQVIRTGQALYLYNQPYVVQNGAEEKKGYLNLVYQPYREVDGTITGVIVLCQEVTSQFMAQWALEESEARQRYLLTLSDRLRTLADPAQIQYEAARVLGEHLKAGRVGYAETQADAGLVAVTRNFTQADVPGIEGVYHYNDYGADLLASLQAGQTVVRPDIAADPTLTDKEKEAHAVLQLGATLNVPLVKQGQLVAILFVHYPQAHDFPAGEVALVQETAERIWSAVERVRAEIALRQNEQRFRFLADALPQAIWVTDPEGNVAFFNKWWLDYCGIPYQASTAWQVANDSVHPEDAPVLVAAFREAMRLGKGFEIEQRNRSASGEYRWFLNRGEPNRDPQTGQITQWVGISVDINDRKQALQSLEESEARYRQLSAHLEQQVQERTKELAATNQELARANEEYVSINEELTATTEELTEANTLLLRSNENLQRFAYVASHDLQEPLRKIQQFGDLLKMGHTASSRDELFYLERMQSAANRMSGLIRDLLNFSRISTQREADDEVSLDEVVKTVLEDLELVIEETGAQVRVGPLPTVLGNALQLGQLFGNLLSNALKFRRPNIPPFIEIRASWLAADHLPQTVKPSRKAVAYHFIEVIDNGIGFDEKYLDRIFQVFQRLHSKMDYAGTGIGLAICEMVVTNQGGAITASSQPEQGAAFGIYLPI